MRRVYLAGACAALLTAPAAAQSLKFTAMLRGELGYITNPFVNSGIHKGTGLGSVTFSPTLSYARPRSDTSVSASYTREQYFRTFGHSDRFNIAIARDDQLSAQLKSQLGASFATTNNATFNFLNGVTIIDPRDIGRRTRDYSANAGLTWQATAKDTFSGGANVSHQTYNGNAFNGLASDYTQYGANLAYDRTLDARTSVGVTGGVSIQHSQLYPGSRAYQPSITARRQLNATWTANGHIGLVFQQIDGPFGGSSTHLGYGAQVCGTYPRSSLCFAVDKSRAPSGFGGLRNNLIVSANASHSLSARSRVNFGASYTESKSNQGFITALPNSAKAAQASADYSRDISQRIAAGFGAQYQWRDSGAFSVNNGGLGAGKSFAAKVNISAKLGRI